MNRLSSVNIHTLNSRIHTIEDMIQESKGKIYHITQDIIRNHNKSPDSKKLSNIQKYFHSMRKKVVSTGERQEEEQPEERVSLEKSRETKLNHTNKSIAPRSNPPLSTVYIMDQYTKNKINKQIRISKRTASNSENVLTAITRLHISPRHSHRLALMDGFSSPKASLHPGPESSSPHNMFESPEWIRQKNKKRRQQLQVKQWNAKISSACEESIRLEEWAFNEYKRHDILNSSTLQQRLSSYINYLLSDTGGHSYNEALVRLMRPTHRIKTEGAQLEGDGMARDAKTRNTYRCVLEALLNLMDDQRFLEYSLGVQAVVSIANQRKNGEAEDGHRDEGRDIRPEVREKVDGIVKRYEERKKWRDDIKKAIEQLVENKKIEEESALLRNKSESSKNLGKASFRNFSNATKVRKMEEVSAFSIERGYSDKDKMIEVLLSQALNHEKKIIMNSNLSTSHLNMSIKLGSIPPTIKQLSVTDLDLPRIRKSRMRFTSDTNYIPQKTADINQSYKIIPNTASMEDIINVKDIYKTTNEFIQYCSDSLEKSKKDTSDAYNNLSRIKYLNSDRSGLPNSGKKSRTDLIKKSKLLRLV